MKKEPSSGKKIAKKARKIYYKEMRKTAEELGRTFGNALKPKPRYIPMWLWIRGLKIFLKIK